MKHGSLFSGIGGFDLAAEWMGWENVFHCENNSFCQRILKHYWPDAKSYEDITTTDFSEWKGGVDIVSGGFPCQPFSGAGKRKGKEDNRYLWPEMLRAIKEIQPTWIVAENVHGIINQGRGMVFEQVQTEMENEGYQVQSYLLPACSKDAPHRRDRVWIIANTKNCSFNNGRNEKSFTPEIQEKRFEQSFITSDTKNKNGRLSIREKEEHPEFRINGLNEFTANTENERLQKWDGQSLQNETHRTIKRYAGIPGWQDFPTKPGVCGGNDGIPNRVDRIKALGNAIVPQVAYEIFKAIDAMKTEP